MFDPLANFKLNKIKKGVDSVKAAVDALPTSLSSSFTDVKNAISGVSTKVDGVSTDLASVSGSDVLKNGAVKSVQRGLSNLTGVEDTPVSKSITISGINPNKSMVIVNALYVPGGDEYLAEIVVESLSSTQLKVQVRNNWYSTSTIRVSWQVIEFY